MKYKLQNIRIYSGKNSRGDFQWLQADLFNDADVFANPARLPRYYNMTDAVINMYKTYAEQTTENNETFLKVNEVSLNKAIAEGKIADISHIDHITALEYPLPGYWARINRTDIVDPTTGAITAKKGDYVRGQNGEIVPVNSITLYLKKGFDPDENKWVYIERPEQVARRVLERHYKKYDDPTQQVAQAASAEPAPTAEPAPATSKEDEIAELQAKLAQMQNGGAA